MIKQRNSHGLEWNEDDWQEEENIHSMQLYSVNYASEMKNREVENIKKESSMVWNAFNRYHDGHTIVNTRMWVKRETSTQVWIRRIPYFYYEYNLPTW